MIIVNNGKNSKVITRKLTTEELAEIERQYPSKSSSSKDNLCSLYGYASNNSNINNVVKWVNKK